MRWRHSGSATLTPAGLAEMGKKYIHDITGKVFEHIDTKNGRAVMVSPGMMTRYVHFHRLGDEDWLEVIEALPARASDQMSKFFQQVRKMLFRRK